MVLSIVLADDTADIRLLTRTQLQLEGDFEVVGEAATGREAVDLARQHQPDLVLLDLAMPEMDGLQALPLIRSEAPATQVVVLSGFDRHAVGDEALALGAAQYVQKGRPLRELVAILREVGGHPAPAEATTVPAPPPSRQSDLDFVAMVVHDLRSPLTSIRGAADLLARDEAVVDGPSGRLLDIVRRQSSLMSRLVDDLLTVARAEGGQLHLTRQRIDLRPVIESLASIDDHDVSLRCPDVSIDADPERIAQIVTNLVSNAVHHGAPPIEVDVGVGEGRVRIAVRDHGAGVPPDREGELFQRFSPLARTSGGGNGLGLHIVRQLARAHGGGASYERASPGSRFVVDLPAEFPR